MAYIVDSNQYLFDRTLKALRIAFRATIKLAVYLPLWFSGYLLTSQLLDKTDDSIAWILLIVLFTILMYQSIFFIKGLLIGLKKNKGNLLWMPLFIVCILFTCVFPVWQLHSTVVQLFHKISPNSGNLLAWLTSLCFGIYVYSRYNFLTDIAPRFALLVYRL